MELKKRILAKALTWQIMGFGVMTILGYLTTGSLSAASGLALGSFVIGTFTYILHERAWGRVRWGTVAQATDAGTSPSADLPKTRC